MKVILRFSGLAISVILVLATTVLVEHTLRKPNIRGFDADEMGRLEAAMWRSYYEGRWVKLGWQTMAVAHQQYLFSWWDSLRMASHAARAAMHFRKNTDSPECLPELESYYAIVRKAAPREFDFALASQLELEWWKERRRGLAPQDYARTIAKLTGLIYGLPEKSVLPSATSRAEAMAYRDARRDGQMTDDDWSEIALQLTRAYASLKAAITTHP